MRRQYLIAIAVCALYCVSQFAISAAFVQQESGVSSPLKHFLSKTAITKGSSVFLFSVDLNSDGRNEILVSPEDWKNGKAGNTWQIYVAEDEGYFYDIANIVSFRKDAYRYMYVEDLGRYAIVTYSPASAGSGSVVSIFVDGGRAKEEKLYELNPKASHDDEESYLRLFEEEGIGAPTIKTIPYDQVRENAGSIMDEDSKTPGPKAGAEYENQLTPEQREFRRLVASDPDGYMAGKYDAQVRALGIEIQSQEVKPLDSAEQSPEPEQSKSVAENVSGDQSKPINIWTAALGIVGILVAIGAIFVIWRGSRR